MNKKQIPNFQKVKKGKTIKLTRGKMMKFPTRKNYIDFLISKKIIKDEKNLILHPNLIIEIQKDWHKLGQQGCKFAQFLSLNPLEHGWLISVVNVSTQDPWEKEIIFNLNKQVSQSIRDSNTQALSLIFPLIKSHLDLINLINAFNKLSNWFIEPGDQIEIPGKPPLINIGIRVALNSEGVLAEVLGFGPFDFFSETRQSPFTEIVFVTKPKIFPQRFEKMNSDPQKAYLADMPLRMETKVGEKMWAGTFAHKKKILANFDDPRAKARVTFSVPLSLWNKT